MPLLRLTQFPPAGRRVEPSLRLPRRDLGNLRRWLDAAAEARLAGAATPALDPALRLPAADRRDTVRRAVETAAELRPISAIGIGLVRAAAVRDVSADGIAVWTAEALPRGQQICLQIAPPPDLPRRRFRQADQQIQILGVVRYCRPDGNGFILGCGIGISWTDSLANQMFPPDLVARRTA